MLIQHNPIALDSTKFIKTNLSLCQNSVWLCMCWSLFLIRMNIILAGGYLAKAKGLTTSFGKKNKKKTIKIKVMVWGMLTKLFLGDIDCFMDPLAFVGIREMMSRRGELEGCDFKKMKMVEQEDYIVEGCFQVYNIVYDRVLTNVQVGPKQMIMSSICFSSFAGQAVSKEVE